MLYKDIASDSGIDYCVYLNIKADGEIADSELSDNSQAWDCARFTVLCKRSFTNGCIFLDMVWVIWKGTRDNTVFMGVNIMLSNILFQFYLDNNCASNGSVGLLPCVR